MKALVYTGPNSIEFRTMSQPQPGPDEVLVRVSACGICGSDMHAYHGHDARRPPPLILGHEAAGTVMSGPNKGMRITINPLVVPEDCETVAAGRPHLSPRRQIISMPPRPGGFAEFTVIPRRNIVEIPEGMSFETAALAEPLAVCWHAVAHGLKLLGQPAATVRAAVLGGGAIGLGAALVLQLLGVPVIRVGETNSMRRDTLRRAGDFAVYEPGASDEPGESAVDLVIDAVGAASTRAASCHIVRPGGVIVHAGLLPGQEGLDVRRLTLQEITFTGTYCYTPQDFQNTVDALAMNRFSPLNWMETRPLSDGAAAFADIDAGHVRAAKIVLRM